jgi:hypothetical protein
VVAFEHYFYKEVLHAAFQLCQIILPRRMDIRCCERQAVVWDEIPGVQVVSALPLAQRRLDELIRSTVDTYSLVQRLLSLVEGFRFLVQNACMP